MAKKFSRIDISEKDVFKDIHDSAAKTETKVVVLKTALEAINQAIAKTKKEAAGMKGVFGGIDPSSIKNQKEFNKAVSETAKITKQSAQATASKAKVTKALTVEEAKLKEEMRLANLESRQVAKLKLAEEGSVKKLQAKLAILTREWDKLSEAERKNTDRGKRLKTGIDQTTASVTKLEQATGRHQRNVGNYGSALDGLKGKFHSLIGFASQLGLVFGGAALLRSGISTVVQFDAAIADLSAITGAVGKDLDFFKEKSIELGKNVKGGASAVVEAYKLIGSAKPELLENASALNSVTEAAILLAKASGMELPDAATALTDAMNQFGVGADQASKFVDILAAGAKFGAAEIPQITEALLKFGAVAKTSNVSIQESTGLIESLAEKGLKGAEAGTALRNVMLKLSAPDALPKEAQDRLRALGVNFDVLKDKSKPFSERLEALKPLLTDNAALIKVFGTENAVAATTLLSSTERIKELTASVDENGVALDQANARSKTISEAFNRLKETINSLILDFANGSNAAGGFVSTLDFISKNLTTIISIIGTALKLFLIYKTRMIAMTIAQKAFGDGTGKMNFNLKQLQSNLKDAGGGLKGFASAAKGVGWAALIMAVVEFGKAFYDVASGALFARFKIEQLALATEKGLELGQKWNAKQQQGLSKELALIELRLSRNEISEAQAAQMRLEENKRHKKRIEEKITELRLQRDEMRVKRDIAKSEHEAFKESTIVGVALTESGLREQSKLQREHIKTSKSVQAYNAAIRELQGSYKEVDTEVAGLTVDQNNLNKSTSEGKEVEKLNTELEKQNEYLSEQTELLETLDEQRRRSEARGVQTDIDTQIANLAKVARETGELDVDILEATILKKFELERAHVLERERFEIDAITEKYIIDKELARQSLENDKTKLLEQEGLTPENKLAIEANYQNELKKLELDELQRAADLELQIRIIKGASNEELIEIEKSYNDEINTVKDVLIDAQIEFSSKISDVKAEAAKKDFETQKKWIDLAEELFTQNIDKKIALIEKEMEAHKTASEELRRLAEEGNIQATQSIAEEQRLENEAMLEKEKLEERKRQLEMVAAFIRAYLNALEEGKEPAEALGQAATSGALLTAAIAGLPVFFEGTEDTGTVANPLDSNGGRVAVIHDNERILTKKHNQAIGDMSNDEVVRRIQMSKIAEASGNIAPSGWDNAPLLASLNGLSKEMKSVKKAIEDKPVHDWQIDRITSEVLRLTKKTTQGNSITYNRFRKE